MIKGIIFDCDGVLLDSEPIFTTATEMMMKERRIDFDMSRLGDSYGITVRHFCQLVLKVYPELGDLETFIRDYYEYCDRLLMSDDLVPMKGLQDFVRTQRARGMKMAIASSSPRYYVRHKIDLFGISDCFDLIVCADDVTRSKPDPQVYLIATERLKEKKEDLIVIEDAPNGIASARAAGLYVVGFKGSELNQDTSEADEEVYRFEDIQILKGI